MTDDNKSKDVSTNDLYKLNCILKNYSSDKKEGYAEALTDFLSEIDSIVFKKIGKDIYTDHSDNLIKKNLKQLLTDKEKLLLVLKNG